MQTAAVLDSICWLIQPTMAQAQLFIEFKERIYSDDNFEPACFLTFVSSIWAISKILDFPELFPEGPAMEIGTAIGSRS